MLKPPIRWWRDFSPLADALEQEKLCLLVMIGVRADGRKELAAPASELSAVSETEPHCAKPA